MKQHSNEQLCIDIVINPLINEQLLTDVADLKSFTPCNYLNLLKKNPQSIVSASYLLSPSDRGDGCIGLCQWKSIQLLTGAAMASLTVWIFI